MRIFTCIFKIKVDNFWNKMFRITITDKYIPRKNTIETEKEVKLLKSEMIGKMYLSGHFKKLIVKIYHKIKFLAMITTYT